MKPACTGCALGKLEIAFRQQARKGCAVRFWVFILHAGKIRPSLHVVNETQSRDTWRSGI
jgi:hypothetical protein